MHSLNKFDAHAKLINPAIHKRGWYKVFSAYPLALSTKIVYYTFNTRAVPLVRKVNAHNGRVFYFQKILFRDGGN
jgi:hypothetical protein